MLSTLLLTLALAADPVTIPLYAGAMPDGTDAADAPVMFAHLPPADARNGTACVICPGGGYGNLALDHEGKQVGEWLAARGVCAFVLKYRLAPKFRHPAPLNDVQRAVRTVRAKAADHKIDPERVGVWGFSAGGHLASTIGTHFDAGLRTDDPVDRNGCRPSFLVLAYPVITLEPPVAHMGSRNNLLGKTPDPKLVESLCNDKQVTKETPPTFLFHTNEDAGVVPENSVQFYLALRKAKVPAELHIFEKGKHGIGLAQQVPEADGWPDRLEAWMKGRGLLAAKK